MYKAIERVVFYMSNEQIEKNISEVNGSLAIEGMPLTEKEKDDMRSVLRGDQSFKEMKQKILADYQSNRKNYE